MLLKSKLLSQVSLFIGIIAEQKPWLHMFDFFSLFVSLLHRPFYRALVSQCRDSSIKHLLRPAWLFKRQILRLALRILRLNPSRFNGIENAILWAAFSITDDFNTWTDTHYRLLLVSHNWCLHIGVLVIIDKEWLDTELCRISVLIGLCFFILGLAIFNVIQQLRSRCVLSTQFAWKFILITTSIRFIWWATQFAANVFRALHWEI